MTTIVKHYFNEEIPNWEGMYVPLLIQLHEWYISNNPLAPTLEQWLEYIEEIYSDSGVVSVAYVEGFPSSIAFSGEVFDFHYSGKVFCVFGLIGKRGSYHLIRRLAKYLSANHEADYLLYTHTKNQEQRIKHIHLRK